MKSFSLTEIDRAEATRLVGGEEARAQLESEPLRQFLLLTGVEFIRFPQRGNWRYMLAGEPEKVAAAQAS